jgi:small subunit ribosomal protein S17
MAEANQKVKRTVTGKVVSNKADKTITVLVERQVKHPLYGKFIRRSTRILAHDEENQCSEGDWVKIEECPPYSRRKSWKLSSVVKQAQEA